jgi:tyrosine-protein kinase Etk/Wzc
MPHEPQKRVLELVPSPHRTHGDVGHAVRAYRGGREPATLREVLTVLGGERWTVAAVAAGVFTLAAAYSLLTTPVYESDVVIQVEEKPRALSGIEEVAPPPGEPSPAETQIEIVRSRKLLGQVVDELKLDIGAQPRRFPVVGGAIARAHRGAGPAPALLGLDRFAWGGERIRLSRLEVAPSLLGEPLTLTALERGRFRLSDDDGVLLAEGEVGRPAEGPGARIAVDELVARPGTTFVVGKRLRADAVDALREDLRAEEKGKKTGILVLWLEGTDPARVTATLESIAAAFVRQNVERRSAEVQQKLDFLEEQLPVLKSNLDRAEIALEAFQRRKGTVSLSQETQAMLARAVDVEKEISSLELERTAAERRFTAQHPEVLSISNRIAQLRATRGAIDARLRGLPVTELDSARLSRDVKVSSELYLALLNRTQELRVMRSAIVANVSVIDPARVPYRPVRSRAGLIQVLGLLLGLAAGATVALARRAWASGADDPGEIEVATGLPVYATVPHSAGQDRLRRAARQAPGSPEPALAAASPGDVAVEHLRGLRTALHHAVVEARSNVVAVSSPSTGVGKSFVCVNLGHLLAAAGWRVLLVDADLRKGRLHRHFSLDRQPGLSDVLCGFAQPQEAIRGTGAGQLDFLPSGRLLPNPAELLGSQRFHQLLSTAARSYDLVILDCPPALAVTDPVLVAGCAGVTLMVLQAGQHPMEEILAALQRFTRSGVKVRGLIVNDFEPSHGPYASDRRYEYRSEET